MEAAITCQSIYVTVILQAEGEATPQPKADLNPTPPSMTYQVFLKNADKQEGLMIIK